jgi:hypothetical protein
MIWSANEFSSGRRRFQPRKWRQIAAHGASRGLGVRFWTKAPGGATENIRHHFLSPRRGFNRFALIPTVITVGYYLPLLRSLKLLNSLQTAVWDIYEGAQDLAGATWDFAGARRISREPPGISRAEVRILREGSGISREQSSISRETPGISREGPGYCGKAAGFRGEDAGYCGNHLGFGGRGSGFRGNGLGFRGDVQDFADKEIILRAFP